MPIRYYYAPIRQGKLLCANRINPVATSWLGPYFSQATSQNTATANMRKKYRVALSFSGNHRPFVNKVADRLAAIYTKPAIFYDKYHEAELARPDLDIYIQDIYRERCDLFVVFISKSYAEKTWCNIEWRVVREIINQKKGEGIMLLRFDNTEIPGIVGPLDGYIEIDKKSAQKVADLIAKRLHMEPAEQQKPQASRKKLWTRRFGGLLVVVAIILVLKFALPTNTSKQQKSITDTQQKEQPNDSENKRIIKIPDVPREDVPTQKNDTQKGKVVPELTTAKFGDYKISGNVTYKQEGVSDAIVKFSNYPEGKTGVGGSFEIPITQKVTQLKIMRYEVIHPDYKTISGSTPYTNNIELYFEAKKDKVENNTP